MLRLGYLHFEMIKLALVDNDARLLELLKKQLLTFSEIELIVTCTSGMRFAEELMTTSPDQLPNVIVMDIAMDLPDEGITATSKIKKLYPAIEIIMFTISDKDDLIFEAFKAGAMGYLLKNETPEFIVRTILDVKEGDAQMSPSIARKTIQYLAKTSQKVSDVHEEAEALTSRELETINLVSKGYTYNQIGEMLHIAPTTVKKHMTNIFAKLHVKNKIEALIKTEGLREQHLH